MDATDQAKDLDGVWEMVRAELAGEPAPDLVVQNTTMVFDRGRYQVLFQGEPADAGSFVLSATPQGKVLCLHGTAGTNAGRTIPCLYQLVGERLRISFGLDGKLPASQRKGLGTNRIYRALYRKQFCSALSLRKSDAKGPNCVDVR